jgi:hypothetical protein
LQTEVVRKAREKGLFRAGFSARIGQEGWISRQKADFPGDFQGANLTMRENFSGALFKRR